MSVAGATTVVGNGELAPYQENTVKDYDLSDSKGKKRRNAALEPTLVDDNYITHSSGMVCISNQSSL
jgi:hypothetical protein